MICKRRSNFEITCLTESERLEIERVITMLYQHVLVSDRDNKMDEANNALVFSDGDENLLEMLRDVRIIEVMG